MLLSGEGWFRTFHFISGGAFTHASDSQRNFLLTLWYQWPWWGREGGTNNHTLGSLWRNMITQTGEAARVIKINLRTYFQLVQEGNAELLINTWEHSKALLNQECSYNFTPVIHSHLSLPSCASPRWWAHTCCSLWFGARLSPSPAWSSAPAPYWPAPGSSPSRCSWPGGRSGSAWHPSRHRWSRHRPPWFRRHHHPERCSDWRMRTRRTWGHRTAARMRTWMKFWSPVHRRHRECWQNSRTGAWSGSRRCGSKVWTSWCSFWSSFWSCSDAKESEEKNVKRLRCCWLAEKVTLADGSGELILLLFSFNHSWSFRPCPLRLSRSSFPGPPLSPTPSPFFPSVFIQSPRKCLRHFGPE